MIRKIIAINKEKCNGCGLCVKACHEGAIGIVDGKASLLRDDYCDGLGNCLPVCPSGAIAFEEREAEPFNQKALSLNQTRGQNEDASCLNQWPLQIKLVPVNASYFDGADLLIAADCCAYSHGSFHKQFMKNKITLIGCPKLDGVNYSEKLTHIMRLNNINSVTAVRMEVPCCSGIEHAAKAAVESSGKNIEVAVVTLSIKGEIIS
jgi:NAD-dependent dihydropyrimidine dehydrogenase PreA subunit